MLHHCYKQLIIKISMESIKWYKTIDPIHTWLYSTDMCQPRKHAHTDAYAVS